MIHDTTRMTGGEGGRGRGTLRRVSNKSPSGFPIYYSTLYTRDYRGFALPLSNARRVSDREKKRVEKGFAPSTARVFNAGAPPPRARTVA